MSLSMDRSLTQVTILSAGLACCPPMLGNYSLLTVGVPLVRVKLKAGQGWSSKRKLLHG